VEKKKKGKKKKGKRKKKIEKALKKTQCTVDNENPPLLTPPPNKLPPASGFRSLRLLTCGREAGEHSLSGR